MGASRLPRHLCHIQPWLPEGPRLPEGPTVCQLQPHPPSPPRRAVAHHTQLLGDEFSGWGPNPGAAQHTRAHRFCHEALRTLTYQEWTQTQLLDWGLHPDVLRPFLTLFLPGVSPPLLLGEVAFPTFHPQATIGVVTLKKKKSKLRATVL